MRRGKEVIGGTIQTNELTPDGSHDEQIASGEEAPLAVSDEKAERRSYGT